MCCTVRGDLIKALKTLAKREKKFDHVLIETTGLADPAPVAFVRPRERTLFRGHRLPCCLLAAGGPNTRLCRHRGVGTQPLTPFLFASPCVLPARFCGTTRRSSSTRR